MLLAVTALIAFPVFSSASTDPPLSRSALFFVADGMRPDVAQAFAAEGAMPTLRNMIQTGVRGTNGMIPPLPPNTGAGWHTLITGAWSGRHGVTNNNFDDTKNPVTVGTSAFTAGVLRAETLAKKAEDAGLKVALLEWSGGRISGASPDTPVLDYRNFYSSRGVLVNYDLLGQPAGANAFGVDYAKVTLTDASGWTNVPQSLSPPKETRLTINTTYSSVNPTRTYYLYIYAPKAGSYDHVLLAPSKDGAAATARLTQGQWAEVKVTLTGNMAGKSAGLYVKVVDLAPDLSRFRVYYTSVTRLIASPASLEDYLATNFPTSISADYAPLESGIIDEGTYVEQGLLWNKAYIPIFKDIMTTYHPDVVFAGYTLTDEFQHQFLALIVPGTQYYEAGKVAARLGYIRAAYAGADETLALLQNMMPSNSTTFVASDHGFGAQWLAINAGKILFDAGLQTREQTRNARADSVNDKVVAAWAGATLQVYVNLKGREPSGVVPPEQYEQVRNDTIRAFSALGPSVIDRILLKEKMAALVVHYTNGTATTATMLYEYTNSTGHRHSTTGDVVIFVRPPYQFDASTRGEKIAFSQFFGQHGYHPDMVDSTYTLLGNLPWVNMHSSFFASGPRIVPGKADDGVAAIDLAPTIAFALGIPVPAQSQGRVLHEIFSSPTTTSTTVTTPISLTVFDWTAYVLGVITVVIVIVTAAVVMRRRKKT